MRNVPAKGAHNVSTNGGAQGQLIKVKEEQPVGVYCTNCGDRWPPDYIEPPSNQRDGQSFLSAPA